jgi:PAS domain S-box-containing protein
MIPHFKPFSSWLTSDRLWIALTFASGLAITIAVSYLFAQQNQTNAQAIFYEKTRDVMQTIEDRAQRLESRLRLMSALHQTMPQQNQLNSTTFNSYIDMVYSLHPFKAIWSFSFIERVPSNLLAEFEKDRRQEDDLGFKVRSQGSASDSYIVKYIQPLTPNKSILGLDLGTNPVARRNLEDAIASNTLRLSSNINIERQMDTDATYMLSLPVFKRHDPELASADSPKELVGVFNTIFTAADFLHNIADMNKGMFNFELFENYSAQDHALVYSYIAGSSTDEETVSADYPSRFFTEKHFTIAGRSFTLRSSSTAVFEQKYVSQIPVAIGLFGLLLSSLATGLVAVRFQKQQSEQHSFIDQHATMLQFIIKKLPGLVAYWNSDLRCEFSNEGYQHYFGRTQEEMHLIHIKDLLSAPLYDLNEVFISGALRGQNQSFERKITKPNGEVAYTLTQYLVVKDNDRVQGFVAYITDISPFKTAEKKALFSEVALNTISQGIVVTDRNNKVQYVNPAFSAITGYQAEEVIGTSTRVLQGVKTDLNAIQTLNQHIANAAPVTQVILNYRKDGNTFWNEMSISPVQQSNGEIINFVGVVNDITQRIHAEQERAKALADAQSANQSKTMFLANTSHEMRTPLHGMLGMLQLLQKTNLSAQQEEYAGAINSAAKSLLEQINQLLDLSKLEAKKITLEPHAMQLASVRDETMQWLPILTNNKPVHIRFDIEPQIANEQLLADSARLRQIIINLSSNAIRFTPRGEVNISVELMQRDDKACTLKFSVQDTGIGIARADIQRIFNNFEQVDTSTTRTYSGTGLGLPISKQLVELMGGTLEVESTPNVGSHFYFQLTLPFATVSQPTTALENPVSVSHIHSPHPLHQIHILVAEDNLLNQKVARMLLESEGAIVTIVENGKQAVETLRASHSRFDVVLMDLQMPEMDGYTATQTIRQELGMQSLPIIAITASAMLNDREESLMAGMNDYVSKPFNVDQLIAVILKQLGER